ncbi:hypothetical protein [Bradyrhizobium sp. BWA-3-5]|uniref:hypothetical protein n=1 Tax=Bradyrhizobium sp. BWA-3-5 TaxID=3080013 RepID=UPI00293EAF84|nr:hypothetical protein [Bradyrhizobium sp. BWA-3-5]WOH63781.1 hypothetical protein RX331_24130 [Bradyrhizobium sp. BWA-3-5]
MAAELGFDVIKEARDGLGIQVAKLQHGNAASLTLRDELEQKFQRIPVGVDAGSE